MRTRKAFGLVALCAVVALSAPACGNRLSTEEIVAQNTVTAESAGSGSVGVGSGEPGTIDEGSGDTELAPGQTSTGGGTTGGDATTAAAGGAAAGGGAAAAGGGGGGPKAPIVIGFIAWLSGFGGETISPTRDVFQAWAKSVNARGGINGHPVQVLVGDHGGREDTALALAKDFVESKGAIILSTNANGTGLGDYAKSKGIPTIGSIMTGGNWNSNPMLFPPVGAELNSSWGAVATLKRAGVKKVAQMFCAESPDCEAGSGRFRAAVEEQGLELVASQRYSETQADFTSECIQMQGAGAEAVYPTGSTAAMIRMARTCSRQGFKPVWIAPTMDDTIASNPDFDNAIAVNASFPWFLRSGSPEVEEYAAALTKYAPNRATKGNTFQTIAWVSGKLIEKAAAKVGDKPTSQEILEGLWAMRGETVGGLTPARTFTRNQPTPETYCVYVGRVQGGKWVAPDGIKPLCR